MVLGSGIVGGGDKRIGPAARDPCSSGESKNGALLCATLGFLAVEPREPELRLPHNCFDLARNRRRRRRHGAG
jgi:hypothetical protein